MLNFFLKKQGIEDYKDLLRIVKKLRKSNYPTPLTLDYEAKLRELNLHPQKTWYKDQGEHWVGWLSGYRGGGFYGRKNNKRTAEFIYNHIMCPPMFIWLAENLELDKSLIETAIKESLKSNKYQTQCKIIRDQLTWKMILPLLSK